MVMVFNATFNNISATYRGLKKTQKNKQLDTCYNVQQFVYKTMCKNIFNCVIFYLHDKTSLQSSTRHFAKKKKKKNKKKKIIYLHEI